MSPYPMEEMVVSAEVNELVILTVRFPSVFMLKGEMSSKEWYPQLSC